ncbi:MAG: DUF1585 domain-containing protein, partial [Phycisphaeraceae bacterium]|nr:DUF1585 domain-containing protein [Phycisphaeraceae bacterium]
QHQEDANCSICHRKMDPIGFAYQNFDLAGRWRMVEHARYVRKELDGKVEWYGKGKTRPLDTSGTLPGGEKFNSFDQFKQVLVDHYVDDLVRGLLKNLVLYGTGRKPDVEDLRQIRSILAQHAGTGYRLRDTFKALVRSKIFLE